MPWPEAVDGASRLFELPPFLSGLRVQTRNEKIATELAVATGRIPAALGVPCSRDRREADQADPAGDYWFALRHDARRRARRGEALCCWYREPPAFDCSRLAQEMWA